MNNYTLRLILYRSNNQTPPHIIGDSLSAVTSDIHFLYVSKVAQENHFPQLPITVLAMQLQRLVLSTDNILSERSRDATFV